MPIEIRELHIRIAVNAEGGSGEGAALRPAALPGAGSSAAVREALIAECVEQVMRVLQEKRER